MKAINIKARLQSVREKCPGMTEDVYQFTEYLAVTMNEMLNPHGVVLAILFAMADVDNGKSKMGHEFPEYLVDRRKEVLDSAMFVLQAIDVVASNKFADEVRAECAELLDWYPTKRAKIIENLARFFGPSVVAAVDWWSGRVQMGDKSTFSNGLPRHLYKEFTEEEIKAFRWRLASGIEGKFSRCSTAIIHTDYGPDQILGAAFDEAGVDLSLAKFILPAKSTMYVEDDKVVVSAGYRADSVTIWEAKE